MNRVFKGFHSYITDWKNLLTHSLVGVAILLIALFAPSKSLPANSLCSGSDCF